MDDEPIKNGYIGKLNEDSIFVYCNEKDYKGGFFFACCEGCEHNPIEFEVQ